MNKPITLCDRCDIAMSCLLNYDGIPCRRNRTVQPTNADRIRAMTDDELSMFLDDVQKYNVVCKPIIADDCADCTTDLCWQCWRDWLKQEVEE